MSISIKNINCDNNTLLIFDLDDTLYNVDNDNKIINNIDDKLFKDIYGHKIIFSNATYQHCLVYIKNMNIIQYIRCIISSDIFGGGKKPYPYVYYNLIKLCNVKKYNKVYFFDDNIENLYIGSLFGWIPVWINKNYDKLGINYDFLKHLIPDKFLVAKKNVIDITSKKSWIKYKFKNINDSLSYFKKNIND